MVQKELICSLETSGWTSLNIRGLEDVGRWAIEECRIVTLKDQNWREIWESSTWKAMVQAVGLDGVVQGECPFG